MMDAMPLTTGKQGAKRLACVLVCALACVVLCSTAAIQSAYAQADKTYNGGVADVSWYCFNPDADVFEISSPAQLNGLALLVNSLSSFYYDEEGLYCSSSESVGSLSRQTFAGKRIELKADIDMAGYVWDEPISNYWKTSGDYGRVFSGVFDGENHRITGLEGSANGLFGCVKDGVVQNVHVSGMFTQSGTSASGSGGIVAFLANGAVYDCSSDMTLSFVKSTDSGAVGGIVGMVEGRSGMASVMGCSFTGSIESAGARVGGIVGYANTSLDGEVRITNCINEGDVVCSYGGNETYAIGGILGSNSFSAGTVSLYRCANKGAVQATGTQSAGGLVGAAFISENRVEDAKFLLMDSYNVGTVSTKKTGTYAAGLIAYSPACAKDATNGGTTVKNCYAAGSLQPKSASRACGLFGKFDSFSYCTLVNNYYDSATAQKAAYGKTDADGYSAQTTEVMTAEAFAATLGEAFAPAVQGATGVEAYPCFAYEKDDATFSVSFSFTLESQVNQDGSDALLYVDGSKAPLALTADDEGTYSAALDGMEKGTHTYRLEKKGYEPLESVFVVSTADQNVSRQLKYVRYKLNIALDQEGALVEVTDADGNAVSQASYDEETRTATYLVGNGTYAYNAQLLGFADESGTVDVLFADAEKAVSFKALGDATWSVRVDSPAGIEFDDEQDVVLYVYKAGRLVFTGYGTAQDIELPLGSYSYTLKASECAVQSGEVVLEADASQTFDLEAHGPWTGQMVSSGNTQVWQGDIDTTWLDNHSDEDVYYLRTPEDLAGLAALTAPSKNTSFAGKSFVLLGSLDLGSHEWPGISKRASGSKNVFSGSFDGRENVIANLSSTMYQGCGLFGFVQNATIENVVITNAVVGDEDNAYAGIVAGASDGGTTFENCRVQGVVSGYRYAAGICGDASSRANVFSKCSTEGSIVAEGSSIGALGGIVSSTGSDNVIESCINKMNITVNASSQWSLQPVPVGGIAGVIAGVTRVSSCTNEGAIESTTAHLGGVVGEVVAYGSQTAVVSGCINTGLVTGHGVGSSAGGFGGVVGTVAGANGVAVIDGCYNQAAVSSDSTEAGASIGGVVGATNEGCGSLSMTSCYNVGPVSQTGTGQRASLGGLLGIARASSKAAISGCYTVGSVSADDESAKVGGIIGSAVGELSLSTCFYRDNVAESGVADAADDAMGALSRTHEQMVAEAFLAELNSEHDAFGPDSACENNGYPVLSHAGVRYISNETVEMSGDVVYNGTSQNPQLVVCDSKGNLLEEGIDYEVSYRASWYEGAELKKEDVPADQVIDPADYTVSIVAKGDMLGSAEKRFRIKTLRLDETAFNAIGDKPYLGSAYDAESLVSFVDAYAGVASDAYAIEVVSPSDMQSLGVQTIRVSGTDKASNTNARITGSFDLMFAIVSGEMTIDTVSNLPFTGDAAKPLVVVRDASGNVLSEGGEYDLTFEDAQHNAVTLEQMVKRATYYAVATGRDGSCVTGAVRASFAIVQGTFTVDEIPEVDYTGSAVAPTLTVRNELAPDTLLHPGDKAHASDYVVTYKDAQGKEISADDVKEVGSYAAVITGADGDYRKDCVVEKPFLVTTNQFSAGQIAPANYTGSPIKPEIEVRDVAGKILEEGKDYTLSFFKDDKEIAAADLVSPGTYTVRVDGVSVAGTVTRTFVIDAAAIVFGDIPTQIYTGSPLVPAVSVKSANTNQELVQGVDYQVSYSKNGAPINAEQLVNAGDYVVSVVAQGNYAGEQQQTFTVGKAVLQLESATAGTYTGASVAPVLELTASGTPLSQSAYLTTVRKDGANVDVRGMVDAGEYEVEARITPALASNFEGDASVKATVKIEPATPQMVVSGSGEFDFGQQKPSVVLKSGDATLPESCYTLTYRDASGAVVDEIVDAGTYQVVAVAKNAANFTVSEVTGAFLVAPCTPTLDNVDALTYTGSAIEPVLRVMVQGKQVSSANYEVTYINSKGETVAAKNLVDPGTYTATILFKVPGNYTTSTLSRSFTIAKKESTDADGSTTPSKEEPEKDDSSSKEENPADKKQDLSQTVPVAKRAEAAAAAVAEASADGTGGVNDPTTSVDPTAAVEEALGSDAEASDVSANSKGKYDETVQQDNPVADAALSLQQQVERKLAAIPSSVYALLGLAAFILLVWGSVRRSRRRAQQEADQLAALI